MDYHDNKRNVRTDQTIIHSRGNISNFNYVLKLYKPRTFEGFYKKTPDRPDSPQKEDMSGEKRTYGHPTIVIVRSMIGSQYISTSL